MEKSIGLSSHEKLVYRKGGLVHHCRELPRKISHFSSSTVSWRNCYSSSRKHRWKFCGLCCYNLADTSQSRILNTSYKEEKSIKPALLRSFLARMATTLSQYLALSTATIPGILLSIFRSLTIQIVQLLGS